MSYPKIGIRPTIDGRWGGVREALEDQTMGMANRAKKLIESELKYPDGTPVQCVISPCTIGGGGEAAKCDEFFSTQNVVGTLTVTPCWCYGTETMDLNPNTIKAVWGFNGTERPGAVYLAAVMAAYAQRGLPAFSIYGHEVQDKDDETITEDVKKKILDFARGAIAVGLMKNKSYVNLGSVSMGIAGSVVNVDLFQKYLGMRTEWVDMTEILRRIELEIYDHEEYERALKWVRENCKEGYNTNAGKDFPEIIKKSRWIPEDKQWEFCVKHALVVRDILKGNPKLAELGWHEESLGRNAIAGGFQGQRMWTDWLPNADFTEATDWCRANYEYFRGGGFSSHFKTAAEMPVTMIRTNIVEGVGPTLQIIEGYTCVLEDDVHKVLDERTDRSWPTTWFAPNLTTKSADSVYNVMAKWGANHGATVYGHVGDRLITLASMLRIPVAFHNVTEDRIFRPHSFNGFGTTDLESQDFRACAYYGPLYR